MNYSTLKKTVSLSFISLMVVGMASAQTDTSKSAKKMMMSDSVGTAKLFGGAKQYNTWSVGVNVGITAPFVLTGGTNIFTGDDPKLAYGLTIKDQLSNAFGIRLDLSGGSVGGHGTIPAPDPNGAGTIVSATNFRTNFISGSLNGVVNIGNISFLKRSNGISFFGSAGFGLIEYAPEIYYYAPGGGKLLYNFKGKLGSSHDATYIHELNVPVGVGVKFRLTEQLDLNFGYTENFVDGYNFEGVKDKFPAKSKYSYGYGGIEYTFGPKSKPSLEWVNPVAMMYDELYDEALRKEVEALKGRVTNVETAIADLKKDSDGDGVSDQFDKCPGTPAGSIVDGAGCPIVFPKPQVMDSTGSKAPAMAYGKIQFEFDSSVLKTASYPILDATAADLKSTGIKVTVAGYASSEGTAAHNLRLSRDRANSVKTYLVNSGVDPKHLKIKAYGETNPVADNSTEEGRVLNRRVEFHK